MGGLAYGYRVEGIDFPRRRTLTKSEYDAVVKEMERVELNPNLKPKVPKYDVVFVARMVLGFWALGYAVYYLYYNVYLPGQQ